MCLHQTQVSQYGMGKLKQYLAVSGSVLRLVLTEQTQLKEIEENSKNEEQEPIYVNVNGRMQTAPVKLEDLHAYILKSKENNCDGFRKEFEVRWLSWVCWCFRFKYAGLIVSVACVTLCTNAEIQLPRCLRCYFVYRRLNPTSKVSCLRCYFVYQCLNPTSMVS